MGKRPVLKSREVCQILENLDFSLARQRGSHLQYRHADGRGTTRCPGVAPSWYEDAPLALMKVGVGAPHHSHHSISTNFSHHPSTIRFLKHQHAQRGQVERGGIGLLVHMVGFGVDAAAITLVRSAIYDRIAV